MEPTPPQRSFLAGFVVLGGLIAFGGLLFLANFAGAPSSSSGGQGTEASGKRPMAPTDPSKVPKVPVEKLWVDGGPFERPAAPEGARNVVFVILTSVRRDHLTPYGAPPELTPFLAELSSKGARFDDLISAAPFSRTAAVAFLTGRHAPTVNMVEPGPGPDLRVLREDVDTLAERLRRAGWQTFGATANFNLNSDSGLAQGFDRYRNSQQNSFNPVTRIDGGQLVSAALAALRERTPSQEARPFYLQLDMVDAHAPLRITRERMEAFDPDQPNVAYRVSVNRADRAIQLLIDELARLGHSPATDTYVVVLSDHGEGNETPKHHGKMHGRLLYESVVGVPWLVVGPDVPAGRVIGGLASHTDVMPTVLGLVGLDAPSGIDGQSWAAQLKGQGDRTTRERAFSDTWYANVDRASIWTERMQCQKDFGSAAEAKDTFADGCYDRKTDPDFLDLKADPALQAELEAWRAEVSKSVTSWSQTAGPAGDEQEG